MNKFPHMPITTLLQGDIQLSMEEKEHTKKINTTRISNAVLTFIANNLVFLSSDYL